MSYLEFPVFLWSYALETTAYTLNHISSKSVPKTSQELWSGHKPTLNHFRIWGCPAHVMKGRRASWKQDRMYVTLLVIQRVLMIGVFMIQGSKRCLLVQIPYSWRMIMS